MARKENRSIACIVCGSRKQDRLYEVVKRGRPFRVVKCRCGHHFINPPPPSDFFEDFYEKEYFSGNGDYRPGGEDMDSEKILKPFMLNARMFKEKWGRKRHGRYLDIGCATGHMVKAFGDLGWDACGIDISQYSTQYAREVRGLNVLTGDVENAGLPAGHFDIISLLNVVEHIQDPRGVLAEAERLLKRNGTLVISTPNSGSMVARLRKARWWGYEDQGHVNLFSLRSLTKLLDQIGLEMFALDCVYSYGYSLRDVMGRAENQGKRLSRGAEYLLMKRLAPALFPITPGLADLLTPGLVCFSRKTGGRKKGRKSDRAR